MRTAAALIVLVALSPVPPAARGAEAARLAIQPLARSLIVTVPPQDPGDPPVRHMHCFWNEDPDGPPAIYFLQASYDLQEWFYLPEVLEGGVDAMEAGFENLTAEGTSPVGFMRVIAVEAESETTPEQGDADADGLTNEDELTQHNTDPLSDDTDDDGLPDKWEIDHGLDPKDSTGENGATGNTDGDGWDNLAEYNAGTDPGDWDSDGDGIADDVDATPLDNNALADPDGENLDVNSGMFARWDFEELDPSGSLASTPQSTGAFETANTAASWDGASSWQGGLTGIPAKCVHFLPANLDQESFPTAYAKLPAQVFSGRNSQTWSMWLQFPHDGLAELSRKRTIFAMGAFEDATDATQNPHIHFYLDPGATAARGDDTLKIDTYWLGGDNYAQRNLATWPVPDGFDDGEWHHLALSFGGGIYRFHLDGVRKGYADSNSVTLNLVQSGGTPWCYVGKFRASPPFAEYQSLGARIDRLRVYSRFLSTTVDNNEIRKIHRQDIDRDGLWDHTESHVRRWRDFNGDGIRQTAETVFLIDPFHHDETGADHDDDEIPSHTEQDDGLKAWHFDSDGDMLPDGWEKNNGLDPLDATDDNGAAGDPDDDGLDNFAELVYQTNPNAKDSDGDKVDDDVEVDRHALPADASDGGQAPPAGTVLALELHVGDPSTSSSERWIMEVFSMRTGQRILSHQSPVFGEVATATYRQFRRGEAYLLKLRHAGTDPEKMKTDQAGFYPDYDWRMAVVPEGADQGKDLADIFPVVLDPWNQETLRVVPPSALNDVNVPLLTATDGQTAPFDGRADKDDLYQTNVRERGVLLCPVQIGVDADGDGEIEWAGDEDATSEESPYRFWLNNDLDSGGSAEAEDLDPAGAQSNYTRTPLLSLRDLEDFFRLQIRVPGLSEGLKQEVLTARLRLDSGALALKYMVHRGGGGTLAYLENSVDAEQQKGTRIFSELAGDQPSRFLSSGVDPFLGERANLWKGWQGFPGITKQQPVLYLLAEGGEAGTAEVVLDILLDDEIVATGGSCWIKLEDIRKMYEIYGVGGTNGEDDCQIINDYLPNADNYDVPSPYFYNVMTRWADSGQYPPPDADTPDEEKDYLIFVHGWRMKPWEKRYFADTAYKRLWWRGYRGRFGMFQWPTEWVERGLGVAIAEPQNYNRSDRKARLSAEALRGLLHDLDGTYPGRVRLFAHSMGGVVASEALRLESMRPAPENLLHSSILMQSASVAGAYDASGPETLTEAYVETKESLQVWWADIASNLGAPDARIPDVWASYPPTGAPLYSGIAAASGNIVNFHNFEDDALAWWLVNQLNKPGSYRDRDNYQTIAEAATGTPPSHRWGRGPVEYQGQHGMMPSSFLVTHSPFNFITQGQRTGRFLAFPTDEYEILAFAAESKTTPLGASVGNGHSTAGPVGGNVDLRTHSTILENRLTSEQEDHSGEFRGTNMIRWEIWRDLLDKTDLPTTRPQ